VPILVLDCSIDWRQWEEPFGAVEAVVIVVVKVVVTAAKDAASYRIEALQDQEIRKSRALHCLCE
jgi:hypothetical protein